MLADWLFNVAILGLERTLDLFFCSRADRAAFSRTTSLTNPNVRPSPWAAEKPDPPSSNPEPPEGFNAVRFCRPTLPEPGAGSGLDWDPAAPMVTIWLPVWSV